MSRYYNYKGRKLPSVTTITGQLDKPALIPWALKCMAQYIERDFQSFLATTNHNEESFILDYKELMDTLERAKKEYRTVAQDALDIGSAVHHAAENYLIHGKEPLAPSDEVTSGFLAFLEWMDEHRVEVIKTEYTVYGRTFAGTLDLLAMVDGVMTVVDFKTTKKPYNNRPYPEWRWQTAAYRSETEAEANSVLRLDKQTGMPDYYDLSKTYKRDLQVFRTLNQLFLDIHPRVAKKVLGV